MKFIYLILALILLPIYAFSNPNDDIKTLFQAPGPVNTNTQEAIYTSAISNSKQLKLFNRTSDYPTQIVRTKGSIADQNVSCDEVHQKINNIFIERITKDKFDYAIYVSCSYDPVTLLANEFKIESFFDPINDEAIAYLNSYLHEYNNMDLFGIPFKVESAKGLIISLNLFVGTKKHPSKPPFVEYRKDRSNFYFKSNYEMKNKLFNDIFQNFYSNNPEQILPFIDRWIFAEASSIYKGILRDSNYTELQPERIFIMENGEEIFTSGLKQYFMNHCEKYENRHCLRLS